MTQPPCSGGLHPALLDQLYFGTARAQAPPVSAEQWALFVQQEIAPRLPQGYTVLEAQGQWRGADGVVEHEQSHVLQLLHADSAASDDALRQIAQRYKTQFSQEAVLQVRSTACVAP